MASVHPKLKLILHFDSKHSVYLDVFQAVSYLLKQNSQQKGICFDENQWTLVSLNITPFQNDDCNCGVFASINAFNATNIKYNKYQETDASMLRYWIASIVISLNMQPRKQTSDRIKNIDIIEKPRFEKLEVVRAYKNTTSQYHLFKAIASSLFALSENVEDELNRELKKKVTRTNSNYARFRMNKLLNEEQDELNKQLPSLNVVGITSTSEDEDKSGSITSDPKSLSSDDDYFKINEAASSLFSSS